MKNVGPDTGEYMNKDVLDKYKSILKKMAITGRDMADLMRMNYISYRKATMSKAKTVPNWVKTFIKAHDLFDVNDSSNK